VRAFAAGRERFFAAVFLAAIGLTPKHRGLKA